MYTRVPVEDNVVLTYMFASTAAAFPESLCLRPPDEWHKHFPKDALTILSDWETIDITVDVVGIVVCGVDAALIDATWGLMHTM